MNLYVLPPLLIKKFEIKNFLLHKILSLFSNRNVALLVKKNFGAENQKNFLPKFLPLPAIIIKILFELIFI